MDKNRPMSQVNEFGRDQVYIVASFNDWFPFTLTTSFEMKKRKSEGIELNKWIAKQIKGNIPMKGKKKEDNIV